jgi:tetratricopeptide (TPR) repeat protein
MAERVAGHLAAAGDLDAALAPALAAAWERYEASEYAGALGLLDRRDAWIDRLALPDADPRRAWGWMRRAVVLSRMAMVREAGPFVDRAEAAARAHGHDDLLAEALHARGKNAQMAGNATESIALFEEARSRFAAAGDRRGTARCDHGIAEMLKQSSRWQEAGPRYEASLAGYAASGDRVGHASCLLGFAHLELDAQLPGGPARIAEAERELAAVGNRLGQAVAALVRGNAAVAEGRLDEAEALYWKSAAMLDAVGSADVLVVKHNLGHVSLLRGDFGRASALLEEAFAGFVAAGREGYFAFSHVALLPCRAAARDWVRFDAHLDAAEALVLPGTGLSDETMVIAADLAATLAREAGEEARAARAAAIARVQESRIRRAKG